MAALIASACVRADSIDDYVKAQMKEEFIPGVCLAIVPPVGEPMVRSYGYANLETMTEFSAQTVFRVASLSKQFCAYSVLALEKEGKLSRTDTLAKYFPGKNPEWEGITIAHLLAHRSGIPDIGEKFDFREDYSPDAFATLVSGKLTEKPGEAFRYNNYGYALLGLIVEKVSGKPFPEFVKERVFDPVGMKDARYYSDDEVISNRADSYRRRNGKYVNTLALRPAIFNGSGGILSSMNDFLAYEKALRERSVLDGSVLDFQWTPYSGDRGYGAGWYREKYDANDVVVHTGTTFGFTSCFLRDLTRKWTVIVFRNSEGGGSASSRDWARNIMDLAVGLK